MDPIRTREQLVDALMDAGDVEHQLMVQYLYAGFSLRRDPMPGKCTPAQYEHVRRWSSTLFMIARQEMEHLSFVNEMLTAIGAPPHFNRENIGKEGLQSPYFSAATLAREASEGDLVPISLRYAFNRFSVRTVARFVCGESPPYADLPHGVDPFWCFDCPDAAGFRLEQEDEPKTLPARLHADRNEHMEIAAGNVQELYEAIADAFRTLDGIFVTDPAEVEIPVEYNVFVFPVTDRASALAAVDLILKQGEGLGDPWNLDSHFRRFMEIYYEYQRLLTADRGFDPAYKLMTNPLSGDIRDGFVRELFDTANDAYVVLLLMLAGLYARAVPASQDRYPHFATALSQMAFAPAMTMIIRPLNEVLVELPIDRGSEYSVGSSYFIPEGDQALLANPLDAKLGDIRTMLTRWEELTARIARLVAAAPDPQTRSSLEYIRQTSHRIGLNLRQIYQAGAYPKFVST
ncbi:MAG TPA: ferritin-like domain-containing protein [Actinomycetota bacterium]|nr:ferritin-like domain-containing protein [Actinomycetota bacterium]